MDGIPIISLSDLLQLSLPLSGTASLRSTSPYPPPQKKPRLQPPHELPSRTPLRSLIGNPKPNPNSSSFTILKRPVLLIGTVDLPPDGSDECSGCGNDSLSFSDGSARICCSVLDFDLEIVGRQVHVLAWNFVPFERRGGGVLEVIRWSFPPSGLASNGEIFLSMSLAYRSEKTHLAEQSHVFGLLNSVSPVFMVPCRNPDMDGEGSVGFLAEVATCTCEVCLSFTALGKHHSFTKLVFVYFLKPASRWRPLISKMVGKVIKVSGLKKRLVFVGGEQKYLMLVTAEKTLVSFCQLTGNDMAVGRELSPRKGHGGMYSGVVTGVYMQGMVVELDEKVAVLTTDSVITSQHSLRVGAIVSVRNFHLVHADFYSSRILLLGTCIKTKTDVKSFSPSSSRCYLRSQNQSLLGKFIESLTFSARFWVLILVSCFRRKFAGTYSEKDILGSKNKEGLAQIYARSSLPQEAYHSQHGIFMEFCRHEQCMSSNESTQLRLKVVLPISNFMSNCEAIWLSIISESRNDAKTVPGNNTLNHLSCEGRSYCCSCRKILSSKDLGLVLMGTLKVCSSTGRLQLVDATGSVDVVIPDLNSNINDHSILEVKDYKVVLEGMPTDLGKLRSHFNDPLSCRNIFQQFKHKELKELVIYIHFYLRDSSFFALTFPLPSWTVGCQDSKAENGGTYHLLSISHKFPGTKNILDDLGGSKSSSMFAEAVLSPYDVILFDKQKYSQPAEVLHDKLKAPSGKRCCIRGCQLNSIHAPTKNLLPMMVVNSDDVERRPAHISCSLNFKGSCLQGPSLFGFVCHSYGGMPNVVPNVVEEPLSPTILLEFRPECFNKYQCLHLRACYLLRCSKEGILCDRKVCEYVRHGKALISTETPVWNTSFSFGEIAHQAALPQDHFSGVGPTLQHNLNEKLRTSDVHLQFSDEALKLVNEEMENENGLFIRFFRLLLGLEVFSVSKCINIMMAEFARPIGADLVRIKLPQGNLISLNGNIEDIHICGDKSRSYLSSETLANQCKIRNICIHLYDECYTVRIRGTLSKYALPVGIGPGVNATFYRVLITRSSSRCHELMLVPSSFIVIESVKEISYQPDGEMLTTPSSLDIPNESFFDLVSLSLVPKSFEGRLVRVKCRVVAVQFLVLEKHIQDSRKSQSRGHSKKSVVKVPLAGFILDDGSSMCCCWADRDRSSILLRLHDAAIRPAFGSRRTSKRLGSTVSCATVGYYLEKLLKKHGRITVNNHGAIPDPSGLGFTFDVNTGKVFTRTEERLLKYVMLNACNGPLFNIVGNAIYPSDLDRLASEFKDMHVPMHSLENMWLREVGYINPLKDARRMVQELSISS